MVRLALLVGAVLVLAGCVGAVSRSDFDAEVQARGGGFDEQLVVEAIDGVAAEVGTDEFEITYLTASPASGTVTMGVRDPRSPDQLDDYTFRGGDLVAVEPVQLSASDDLDAEAFPVSEFAVDELNDMVDDALAAYDTDGGYVQTVSFASDSLPGNPEQSVGIVRINLQSPRSSALAEFTAAGDLLSLEQQ